MAIIMLIIPCSAERMTNTAYEACFVDDTAAQETYSGLPAPGADEAANVEFLLDAEGWPRVIRPIGDAG